MRVPLVVGPLPSCTAPPQTSTLLVVVPGAMLDPEDYVALVQALQAAAASRVRLYITVADVDCCAAMFGGPSKARSPPPLDPIIEAAAELGFESSALSSGRAENVFVAMHSVSGLFCPSYSERCGGVILLGSTPSAITLPGQPQWWALETYSRPMLHVSGMLDGQMKPALMAVPLLQAASMVPKFGARYVAEHKPVVLLPGVNHGQLSNGVPNTARGDLPSDMPHDKAAELIAASIADFLQVHRGYPPQVGSVNRASGTPMGPAADGHMNAGPGQQGPGQQAPTGHAQGQGQGLGLARANGEREESKGEQQQQQREEEEAVVVGGGGKIKVKDVGTASDQLLARVVESARLLAPLCIANGRGDPAAVYDAYPIGLPGPDAAPGCMLLPGGVIRGATGAEVEDPGAEARPYLVHPGELAAAEAFCCAAQRRMVRGLPAGVAERLAVVATAHTDEETFTYSQPTLVPHPGGRLLVHVHCCLFRGSLRGSSYLSGPVGPIYFLKLKKAAAVEAALGLRREQPGGINNDHSDSNYNDNSPLERPPSPKEEQASVLTAAEMNAETMEAARAALPEQAVRDFDRGGRKLRFLPDRDVMREISSPADWINKTQVLVKDDGPGHATVVAPYISTPIALLPRYDRGPGVFQGNHYIKCLSPAWCTEWLMTDGRREHELQLSSHLPQLPPGVVARAISFAGPVLSPLVGALSGAARFVRRLSHRQQQPEQQQAPGRSNSQQH